MRQAGPVIEESRVVEDVHHLRLMALLHELVREKGNRGAAAVLGIYPRTVASCMKTGRLSWRVREALEQGLQSGAGSAAARQRERNDALEGRVTELDGKLRNGLEEVRSAVVGEVKGLLEQQAKALRQLERRLVRLESSRGVQDGPQRASSAGSEPETPKRRYIPPRDYPQLVTLEAEPDEDQVYGDATPVVAEWRRARAGFREALKTGTALERAEANQRALELEIAIIEEHELTLPPAKYPWDWSDHRDHLWRRKKLLWETRTERRWALAASVGAPRPHLRTVAELMRRRCRRGAIGRRRLEAGGSRAGDRRGQRRGAGELKGRKWKPQPATASLFEWAFSLDQQYEEEQGGGETWPERQIFLSIRPFSISGVSSPAHPCMRVFSVARGMVSRWDRTTNVIASYVARYGDGGAGQVDPVSPPARARPIRVRAIAPPGR